MGTSEGLEMFTAFKSAYIGSGRKLYEVALDLEKHLKLLQGKSANDILRLQTPQETLEWTAAVQNDQDYKAGGKSFVYQKKSRDQTRMVYFHHRNNNYSFTEADWQTLLATYLQQIDGEDPQGENPLSPEEESQQQKEAQDEALLSQSIDATMFRLSNAYERAGLASSEKLLEKFATQLHGQGVRSPLRDAARKVLDAPDEVPIEELLEQVTQVTDTLEKITTLFRDHKDGKAFSPEDVSFVRDNFRLRGAGMNKGVYLRPTTKNNELLSLGAQLTKGGEVYGVKIGNEDSPIYNILAELHKENWIDGKPVALWGRADSAKTNQYNAIFGIINEHILALVGAGDEKAYNKHLGVLVEALKKYNAGAVFLAAAKEQVSDLEVANFAEEGTTQIINDVNSFLGAPSNEQQALAYVITKAIIKWKPVAELFKSGFRNAKFESVGQLVTGIQEDGSIVTEDITVKGNMEEVANFMATNTNKPKYSIPEKAKNSLGVSVKELTDAGTGIQAGSRSLHKIWNESPGVAEAVENVTSMLSHFSNQKLDSGAFHRVQKAEKKSVETVFAGLDRMTSPQIKTLMKKRLESADFGEYEEADKMLTTMLDYRKESDPKLKKKLKQKLFASLSCGYVSKLGNTAEARQYIATHIAMTAMGTSPKALVITAPDGAYIGAETDVMGTILDDYLNGKLKVKYTQQGVSLTGKGKKPILRLTRRSHNASLKQIVQIDSDYSKAQLRKLEPALQTEALIYKDVIRQFKEFFKRVDKILPV